MHACIYIDSSACICRYTQLIYIDSAACIVQFVLTVLEASGDCSGQHLWRMQSAAASQGIYALNIHACAAGSAFSTAAVQHKHRASIAQLMPAVLDITLQMAWS